MSARRTGQQEKGEGVRLQESWKPVVGYSGLYEVSDQGRVRRVGAGRGVVTGRVLRTTKQNAGYLMVGLWQANRASNHLVHRLVVEAFVGPIPEGHEVNHLDGDKTNNVLSNLEVVTRSENMKHASANGLAYRGELNGQAVLTAKQVGEIRRRYVHGGGPGYKALGAEYGVSWEAVRNIIKGRVWQHV